MDCESANSTRSPQAHSGGRSMELPLAQQFQRPQRLPTDLTTGSSVNGNVGIGGSDSGSGSSSSSSTTSSPPQYSDDLRCGKLDLLPRQGSGSSTKTCEVDLGDEERDTYSPMSSGSGTSTSRVNSNNNSPSDGVARSGVASSGSGGIGGASNVPNGAAPSTFDNKVYEVVVPTSLKIKVVGNGHGAANSMHSAATKEEKQRQNEEIVILETSSISSETGSWESVFPHGSGLAAAAQLMTVGCTTAAPNERKAKSKEKEKVVDIVVIDDAPTFSPLMRERTYSTGATVTADTSSLFTGVSTNSLLRELDKRENALSTSGTSACFIDASSLRDEDEVLSFPSLEGQPSNDDLDVEEHRDEHSDEAANEDDEEEVPTEIVEDDSPTKKLETFHKVFAKCKVKSKDFQDNPNDLQELESRSSSSSQSDLDSPQKGLSAASACSTNNLSDEEKLWKRELDTQQQNQQQQHVMATAADKLAKPAAQQLQNQQHLSAQEDTTEASVSLAGDADSSDSSEVVKLRREQQVSERKQHSPYVFQSSTQQFSIHPLGVSPKFALHSHTGPATATHPNASHTAAHSDLSYTTDYSSSSPAPSLVWSEYEHRRQQADEAFDKHVERPSLLPDTPHNSIVHIDTASSNTSSIHRDCTLSSSLSHQRDSGAYCSDATDSPVPMPRTPKRSKFDESNPIVSGGVSIKDFSIKQCESPPVKRRTETCPIVSGGFVSLDFERTQPLCEYEAEEEEVELRSKPKSRKPIPGIASWVVDMSDCRSERRKSTSSTSSMDTASGKFRERSDSTSSHKSGCGFYVSLDDMDKKPNELKPKTQMSKSYTAPKTSGFFVNLSHSEYNTKNSEPEEQKHTDDASNDKKNIFSMFIDIGDKKGTVNNGGKKEPFNLAQHLSSSLTSSITRRSEEAPVRSTASSTETLMSKSTNVKPLQTEPSNDSGLERESKSLDYKCNMEPPITVAAIRRISQQQRAQHEAAKRHSWGPTKEGAPPDYKRSISLTANGGDSKDGNNGLMSIIDKLPIISKASSMSVDSSLSPYDEYTAGSKSGLSTCSNNSARNSMSGGERDDETANAANTKRIKKRRRDVQINETFDKSSLASITDGVLSKDISPASTTDTDDLTFQQDEELARREAALQPPLPAAPTCQVASNRSSAIIMETIIETKETASPKKTSTGHTMESLHATIEKQKMLLETVNEHGEVEKSSFVKLSDMDKPVKLDLHSPEGMMSKSAGNHRQINRIYRDDAKGVRPHSWSMTRSTGNSFLNITNSVDNLRSLSRLFPDYSKEFSNSLPNDMILDQMDYIQTDISADSSLASSFSRSGMDESSISCRQPRRLGEDLLKMFLQEIATDMIVEVHGRRIKAHKCILRSRCQYFAAMLAGHGAQSVVSLQGYSYSSVHFALCHIYSGASHPPDGISLMELAALADLLGLEGLKEVTAHALKTNYCHNFHKPCSGCIDGILQVLPVALNHGLDDLYRKCLRWTCRHYLKVWPTRQFAQLPTDILSRCRQQIVAYLTSETVLDTVLDCDNLLAQLAPYRWGGICENLVRDILDAAYAYIADHFASLIASDSFLSLGHDRSCHIPRLESVLLRTASSLTADQACRSYQRVTRLNTVLQAKIIQMPANLGELAKELQGLQEEDLDWDPEYIRLVSAILSAVEQCLIRQCSRAMRVTAWQRMDLDLRKKIQTLARLTEPLDLKRGSSKPVSKASSFGGSTRNQDLYQVKLAIQAHSKRALAQDTQLYKATQTQEAGNVQTAERGVQANNDLREGTSKILKSNSRVHVPQSYRASSQSAVTSERNSINAHRRTQSEVPQPTSHKPIATNTQVTKSVEVTKNESVKQKTVPRLADVRPRYLEPRKARAPATAGPVRSATSSSIPATKGGGKTGRRISSSDSSRNSSPAARKSLSQTNAKIGTKSTNMSLDSLATPSRRAKSVGGRGKNEPENERYSDLGGDSIADSMKSSVITSKTHDSRESLNTISKLSRSNPMIIGKNKVVAPAAGGKLNGNTAKQQPQRPTTIGSKTSRHLQQQNITSTGSSPSSVTTTKSATSRLSSVSSTQSSRDLYKHRSISMPGHDSSAQSPAGATQRRSFLSAKSREILAKRAEKNKLQQQQLQLQQQQQQANSSGDERASNKSGHNTVNVPMRSASHSAVSAAALAAATNNRNSLPSNIPTRRPNTLHLKKTTNGHGPGYASNHSQNQSHNNSLNANNNNHNQRNKLVNVTKAAAQSMKQKIELLIDKSMPLTTSHATVQQADVDGTPSPPHIESKLERSSTFCKESSDLDKNDLHIIE